MNPNSTKQSDPVRVQIYDSIKLTNVINQDTGNMAVTTSVPFDIGAENANLTSTVIGAGLPSMYLLNMTIAHNIQKEGGLLIRYPSQVTVNSPIQVRVQTSDFRV
jgi:hypothetical protein